MTHLLRRARYASFAFLVVSASAFGADYVCRSTSAVLPHETWDDQRAPTADDLYLRARETLDHWWRDPMLLAKAEQSLVELLAIEPHRARGYLGLARLAMLTGARGRYVLTPDGYDAAALALDRAFELEPESAAAWLLRADFDLRSRGTTGPYGNVEVAAESLRTAERYGARNPERALAWASWHELRREFDLARRQIEALLKDENVDDRVAALAHRKLAIYARQGDRPAAARRALERALELEPANPYYWLSYSAFLLEQHADAAAAADAARESLCIFPLADGYRHLAYALYVGWAQDNVAAAEPRSDDERLVEAYEIYPHWSDVMGYSAEHAALAPFVEVLVRIGAPVDHPDPHDGESSLAEAVGSDRVDEAARLIELGADVNRMDHRYGSLLMIAASSPKTDMARLLIEHGADVNARWWEGTALLRAVGADNYKMAELLIEHGADPNIADDRGETPLTSAALGSGSPRMVRLLLRAGADPAYEFPPGQKVAESAMLFGFAEIAELLNEAALTQPQ